MSTMAEVTAPRPRGPLGLLGFGADEAKSHRSILDAVAIVEDNPTGLSLDELGLVLFLAYVRGSRGGRGGAATPLRYVDRDVLVKCFRQVGFLSGGYRSALSRPRERVRLYRATTPEHRQTGLSWSGSLRTAREYGTKRRHEMQAFGLSGAAAEPVRVYTVDAEVSWLLAVNGAVPGLAGTEYVVDVPADADVREVPDAVAPMKTWGRSAAGLLVVDRGRVLMQRRASWIQYGGTWSIPGGAVAPGEEPLAAALRELREEAGIDDSALRVLEAAHVAEPVPGWIYTTHVARLRKKARASIGTPPPGHEAAEHRWVPFADIDALDLHPGFAASWGAVRSMIDPPRPVRVLFVCLGNICRSPLAELLLQRLAADTGVAVEVTSAGVRAKAGAAMDAGSAACAARHGLDGSRHVARRLDADLVGWADVVVALAFHVAPAAERMAAARGVSPVIVDRPAVNPWRMPAYWQEQAYREIFITCAGVLDVVTALPERTRS